MGQYEKRMLANQGSFLLTGTSAKTGAFYGLIVNEDAIFAEILDKNGNDVTDDYGDIANTASVAGIPIGCDQSNHIHWSSVTLASGSVVLFGSQK